MVFHPIFLGLFFSLCATLYGAPLFYFTPPEGWMLADPKSLSSLVKMGFIGKGDKELAPSLNVAIEPADVSLKEYLAAVKAIHEINPKNRWRDLGPFSCSTGEGRLTEIEASTKLGKTRLLQFILLKDKKAYIMTACALKEEFPKYLPLFQQAFRTFTIPNDPQESEDAIRFWQKFIEQKTREKI